MAELQVVLCVLWCPLSSRRVILFRTGCALFGEMRRSACVAARKSGSGSQGRSGEQLTPENDDDDDPLRPWCSCQQPHGGKFMIMCDLQKENCHKWYHGMCAGISPEEGRHMETHNESFICLSCAGVPAFLHICLQIAQISHGAHWMGLSFANKFPLLMIRLFIGGTTYSWCHLAKLVLIL